MKTISRLICGLLLLASSGITVSAGNGKNSPSPAPFSVNLVVNSALCFSAMDNNPAYDEDGIAGQITLTSLVIQSGGSINYNDPGHSCSDAGSPNDGAQPIKIIVSGNMEIQSGGFINTENQSAAGNGGDITLTVGGSFFMRNTALITSSNLTATSGSTSAGNITLNVNGIVQLDNGSIIRANSFKGKAGDIAITGTTINVFGQVISQSNGSGSGTNPAHGGWITIDAVCTLLESSTGEISSLGNDPGADLVHLEGCTVSISGLVQSAGVGHGIPTGANATHLHAPYRPDKPANSTGGIEIWADRITVTNTAEVKSDLCCSGGTTGTTWIDLIARRSINIFGKTSGILFSVHADGSAGTGDNGGVVSLICTAGNVNVSGLGVQASSVNASTGVLSNNGTGGSINIAAKTSIDLTGGTLEARGDAGGGDGGVVTAQAFTSSINADALSLINVTGKTPPDGAATLTACGSIAFPPGVVTPVSPSLNPGVCPGTDPVTQSYVVLPSPECGRGCGEIGLPVLLSDFNAKRNNNFVAVTWTTQTEINNAGFELQRRAKSSGDFVTVANVPSKATGGNSSSELAYSYTDGNSFADASYYRLKQADNNGKVNYSEVRVVSGLKNLASMLVYPNPAFKSDITVAFSSDDSRDIQLADMNGRVIKNWKDNKDQQIKISQLQPGVYILRVRTLSNDQMEMQKIVVTR